MVTKIALIAAAAAILFSTSSAAFAAPKNHGTVVAPKSQQIPEPLYFKYATGEEG